MAVAPVVNQPINQSIMIHLLPKIQSKKWKPIDTLEQQEMTATRKDFPVGRKLKQSPTLEGSRLFVGWLDGKIKTKKYKIFCPLQVFRKISTKILCVKKKNGHHYLGVGIGLTRIKTRTRGKKPQFFFLLRFCPDVGHQLHPPNSRLRRRTKSAGK